jgi:hypothetical protein
MRARTVNEVQSFTRGVDPKTALGLGPDPREGEVFIQYLVAKLPEILGLPEIPEDIIAHNVAYIHPRYQKALGPWVSKYISRRLSVPDEGDETVDSLPYNVWSALHGLLKILGYSESTGLSEAFTRGADPKRSLGIGVDPEDPESYIPYVIKKIPEILGLPEIPEDIIRDNRNWIHHRYQQSLTDALKKDIGERLGVEPHEALRVIPYHIWEALQMGLYSLGYAVT